MSLENIQALHRETVIPTLNLNHEIPIELHNLKNYYSLLIKLEPDKFIFKINVIPNGLEKDMSFNINNKLILVDSIQFLSS